VLRVPVTAPSASSVFGAVRLRYLARAPVLVRGAMTGHSYRFSGADPVHDVARSDVAPLLASGHFRREA